jgi:hypothetical protein
MLILFKRKFIKVYKRNSCSRLTYIHCPREAKNTVTGEHLYESQIRKEIRYHSLLHYAKFPLHLLYTGITSSWNALKLRTLLYYLFLETTVTLYILVNLYILVPPLMLKLHNVISYYLCANGILSLDPILYNYEILFHTFVCLPTCLKDCSL